MFRHIFYFLYDERNIFSNYLTRSSVEILIEGLDTLDLNKITEGLERMIENFTLERKVYRSEQSLCNGIKVLLNFIPDFSNIKKPLDFGNPYFNIYYKGNCYLFAVKIAKKTKICKKLMKEAINEVMTISKKYVLVGILEKYTLLQWCLDLTKAKLLS